MLRSSARLRGALSCRWRDDFPVKGPVRCRRVARVVVSDRDRQELVDACGLMGLVGAFLQTRGVASGLGG